MKILVTIYYPLGRGGAEISTYLMCKELQRRGHEVIIATTGSYAGFMCYKIPHFRSYPFYSAYVYSLTRTLSRMIRKERPDVIYSQDLNTTKGAILAGKRNGVPVAVHLRDYWFVCPKSSCMSSDFKSAKVCSYPCILGKKPFWRVPWDLQRLRMIRSCWKHFRDDAAVIFALNSEIMRMLSRIGVEDKKCFNVHCFRDFDELLRVRAPVAEVSAFKQSLGLKEKVVTYVGSFSKTKGFFLTLDVMRGVLSARKDVSFLFVGKGEGAEQLRGIPDVQHIPWVSFAEMPLIYRVSDVVLGPSLWIERCSGVPLEACAFRIPIIAGNILDVREGKYGVSVENILNASSWKAEILRLLDDPSLRKKLGFEAYRYVLKNYNLYSYIDFIEKKLIEIKK